MNTKSLPDFAIALAAYRNLVAGDFETSIKLYEEAIAIEPNKKAHHAYLGLAMLLQGQEMLETHPPQGDSV